MIIFVFRKQTAAEKLAAAVEELRGTVEETCRAFGQLGDGIARATAGFETLSIGLKRVHGASRYRRAYRNRGRRMGAH